MADERPASAGQADVRRARIILDLPHDVSRESAHEAATLAMDFATSYIDRPSGLGHLVAYQCQQTGRAWVAYWTRARSVVVREAAP